MKNMILGIATLVAVGLFAAFSVIPSEKMTEVGRSDAEFQKFLKQFPKAKLPYVLSKETLLEKIVAGLKSDGKEPRGLSGKQLEDPERFIPRNRFDMVSRVPVYRQPVAQLATVDNYAVVYSSTRGFSAGFKSYSIVLFDKSGKHISTHLLGDSNMYKITSGKVDANLKAKVETYTINWEKDVFEYGAEDNTVLGLTLESSETIDLTKPVKEHDDEFFDKKVRPLKKEEKEEIIGAVID